MGLLYLRLGTDLVERIRSNLKQADVDTLGLQDDLVDADLFELSEADIETVCDALPVLSRGRVRRAWKKARKESAGTLCIQWAIHIFADCSGLIIWKCRATFKMAASNFRRPTTMAVADADRGRVRRAWKHARTDSAGTMCVQRDVDTLLSTSAMV